MTKRTDQLRAGDRVRLPGGLVRTVHEVKPSAWRNYRGEVILFVMYAEGGTAAWSDGNSTLAGSLWEVVA